MALNDFYGRAREIAECIGEHEARVLLDARGGSFVELPKQVEGSVLARIVGEVAAGSLVRKFGTGRLVLPLGPGKGSASRRQRAKEMLRDGASLSQVALACELTERTVSNYRAQLVDQGRQLRLPLGDLD